MSSRRSADGFTVPSSRPVRKVTLMRPKYEEIEIDETPIIKREVKTELKTDKEAEKIVGASRNKEGDQFFVVKWKNSCQADLVPSEIVKQRWPVLVCEFYAERRSWVGSDEVAE